jgi:hypothetical protein
VPSGGDFADDVGGTNVEAVKDESGAGGGHHGGGGGGRTELAPAGNVEEAR